MLKDTLLKLLTSPGPSGFEGACADYIESEMRPCADEIRRDVMGNLVCVKKGAPGGKRILLTAHMDEIGFIVTAIDEDGFLRVATVGGVNPKITQASHVVLASGALPRARRPGRRRRSATGPSCAASSATWATAWPRPTWTTAAAARS